jgi:hypothetical protein
MPRPRPKKIITWRYDDGAGTTMNIPVYQVTKHEGIWLRVEIPALGIHEECSDINLLRARVFAAIKDQLVIQWKSFLQITAGTTSFGLDDFVEATHTNPSLRYEVEVQVSRIEIGTRPDGSTCHRKPEFDSSVHEGLPSVDQGGDGEWWREVHSLVPDTKENRQALVDLGCAIFQLGRELCGQLDSENVETAITQLIKEAALAGMPVLPGPGNRKRKENRRARSEETADPCDGP